MQDKQFNGQWIHIPSGWLYILGPHDGRHKVELFENWFRELKNVPLGHRQPRTVCLRVDGHENISLLAQLHTFKTVS